MFVHNVTAGLNYCFVYVDDLIITSSSEQEHLRYLQTLFKRLEYYDLTINLDKCWVIELTPQD